MAGQSAITRPLCAICRLEALELDRAWLASYEVSSDQSDAWDTTIGSDSLWLMDTGRPPHG
jgi:hypothetical protein